LKQEALKQGLYDGTGVLDKNAKSHAALAVIMQQSTQAQGDFARTADGAANKERIVAAEAENAKAKIGQGLMPIYKEILDVTGRLVAAFGNLPQPIQQATIALTALALLKGPLGGLGGSIADIASSLVAMGPASALAIGALAGLFIVFSNAGTIMEDNTSTTKQYTAALKDMAEGAANAFDKLRTAVLSTEGNVDTLSKLGLNIDQVKRALSGSADDYGKFISAVEKSAQGSDAAEEAFGKLKFTLGDIRWGEEAAAATQLNTAIATLGQSAVEELVSSLGLTNEQLAQTMLAMQDGSVAAGELGLSSGDAASVIDILGKAMDKQKAATDKAKDSTDMFAEAADGVTEKTDTLSDSMKKAGDNASLLKKNLDLLTGGSLNAAEATDKYYAAIEDATAAVKKNGNTLDEHTEKGRANRAAINDTVGAALDLADAMVHQGSTVEQAASFVTDNYIPALRNQLSAAGLSKDAIDKYIASLNLTPKTVETAIRMTEQDKAKADLDDWLKRLDGVPKDAKTAIQALIDEGKYSEAHVRLDQLTRPRSVQVQIETNIMGFINSLPAVFRHAFGFASGGLVPGQKGEAVPAVVHGGEYVLSADVVQRIREGRPNSDLAAAASLTTGGTTSGGSQAGDGASIYAPLIIQGDVHDKSMLDDAMKTWQITVAQTITAGRRS
jgi:hypothetical protein